ncbi:Dihydroxyacetone kinase 1 [Teratosphaeria destructans]|uniref:Dihydroxyacetone kinase 1 n=1 Tax=Teratosphaeria destructans TaxID=418781 RepID=A0A9W7W3P1_9PEZI|nr:Dihydroxyacetone kinase 1 [Teratosphaeria destructans]
MACKRSSYSSSTTTATTKAPTAKHFLNDPTHLVLSALQSITYTNPTTALDSENKIIYLRPDAVSSSQVAIVSGGGSGHEPSFAAFVGPGLLSGAVAGTIFASPSAEQIRRCILQRVDSSRGVLVVVMNYTGDVLNFGMAVEKAKAAGIEAEMVVMGDDAGVGRAKGGKVGRRGIAGTVLVHKIAGALAATGAALKEVHRVAQTVADNTVSIGSSLSHVHVPGRKVDESEETLKQDEVEIGMGIHNEPGSEKTTSDLPGLVKTMLRYMLDPADKDRAFLSVSGADETVLLVNNLGGVSVLEMGGITNEVVQQLANDYGIKPVRIISGTFMTSLNGLGFSISLLKLTETGVSKSMLELLDAPAEATGWSAAVSSRTWTKPPTQTRDRAANAGVENKPSGRSLDPAVANKALKSALERVIKSEPKITRYDTVVGDATAASASNAERKASCNTSIPLPLTKPTQRYTLTTSSASSRQPWTARPEPCTPSSSTPSRTVCARLTRRVPGRPTPCLGRGVADRERESGQVHAGEARGSDAGGCSAAICGGFGEGGECGSGGGGGGARGERHAGHEGQFGADGVYRREWVRGGAGSGGVWIGGVFCGACGGVEVMETFSFLSWDERWEL